jgi:hypothetical protein
MGGQASRRFSVMAAAVSVAAADHQLAALQWRPALT